MESKIKSRNLPNDFNNCKSRGSCSRPIQISNSAILERTREIFSADVDSLKVNNNSWVDSPVDTQKFFND